MSKTEQAIAYMEQIAKDDTHGYDQTKRWGNPDFDCSALVITAWEKAGVPVKTKGATYTGNMLSVFKKCGFQDVTKTVNLNTGTGLKRGDVLLKTGSHVAMYCGNGKLVHASINEKGKTTGGKAGDQTGKEICIRSYYNKPWSNVLRYTESSGATVNVTDVARDVIKGKYGTGTQRKAALEKAGYDYAVIQAEVNRLLKG